MPFSSDMPPRIYLDNAATSWPKPDTVYQAVDRYQRELGAAAGRSGYAEAMLAGQMVEDARARVARLVNLAEPSHVIFGLNGTDMLNLAIHGLVRRGDHVVTTVVEHNSVLRPLAELAATAEVDVTHVPCDAQGFVDPDEIRRALTPQTRLVAITHASNVIGAIQPVAEIARVAHEAGAFVLCDAAQTLGHVPVDLARMDVDLLAAPGHKGLLGPLGTGILVIRGEVVRHLRSVRQGGTGTQSEDIRQPEALPGKFESGNLNVAGIVGLSAGLEYLAKRGIDAIAEQGRLLTARLLEGLREVRSTRIFGPTSGEARVPLVSVALAGYDPQEVALGLDAVYRVQVRSGLHCAPWAHQALGTDRSGGTVRFSLGPFNTIEQIDFTVGAVAELAAAEIKFA